LDARDKRFEWKSEGGMSARDHPHAGRSFVLGTGARKMNRRKMNSFGADSGFDPVPQRNGLAALATSFIRSAWRVAPVLRNIFRWLLIVAVDSPSAD